MLFYSNMTLNEINYRFKISFGIFAQPKWTIMRQNGRSWVKMNDHESNWTIMSQNERSWVKMDVRESKLTAHEVELTGSESQLGTALSTRS